MRRSSLPGLPFPGDPDHYPTRDEVVTYLSQYEGHFGLPVERSMRVTRLSSQDDTYIIEAEGRTYTADQVVVATGPFQTPRTPRQARCGAPACGCTRAPSACTARASPSPTTTRSAPAS